MGTMIAAGIFTAAVCSIIWVLVAIDRKFFGEETEDDEDEADEPSPGKYKADEIPF